MKRCRYFKSIIQALSLLVLLASGEAPAPAGEASGWRDHPGYRVRELSVPAGGRTGFTRLPSAETGITFTNHLAGARAIRNRNLVSGSGVAAGDVDGDGRVDLYFCGLDGPNVLYRNLGNWKFEDITPGAGVACPDRDSTGAAFADVDGDGDLDLLVTALDGGVRLFLNDGHGHFTETTREAGLGSARGSTSMALADIDGDGDLDLYVANYRPVTMLDRPDTQYQVERGPEGLRVTQINGKPASLPEYTNRFEVGPQGQIVEHGEPDDLFLNDGRGHFTRRSFTDGSFLDEEGHPLTAPDGDWGLAVQFHDMNGDGAPDLYVCNDLFSPDRIWINDGHGRFRALSSLAMRNTSTFSMGVDFADINRDGFVDVFTVDMLSRERERRLVQVAGISSRRQPPGLIDNRAQFARNVLHLNRGDGTYADIGYWAGVEASEWSWCPIFLDVDLDGYEDLLVSNGQLHDFQSGDVAIRLEREKAGREFSFDRMLSALQEFEGLRTPNLAFRNRRDGSFEEVGAQWGFSDAGISQGMALADLDGDGDLDVVVNNLGESAGIYRNETSAARVMIRLAGTSPNTAGVGARIRVTGGPVVQTQEIICGGRYLSSDEMTRVFAAGSSTNHLDIEVTWRNGRKSRIAAAAANCSYELLEAASSPAGETPPVVPAKPWFSDVSSLIAHQHVENTFDEFARQPLLPRQLSQLGPGVSWLDVDGDGWEDLVVGGGRGGRLGVYFNRGGKSFEHSTEPLFSRTVGRDQTSIVGVGGVLFVGSSSYEDGTTNGGCVRVYDFARKTSGETILGKDFSVGPLAMADVDGDGRLDLFIGGRCRPGWYPEPADSLLMRNEGGRFVESWRFQKLGLVSAAMFTDLDGDGRCELVIACEWGPIRVFRNLASKPEEITESLGLSGLLGGWNSVAAGDFDGDGRMDLVAGNWGLNTKYQVSKDRPRRLRFGDFRGDGELGLVETSFEDPGHREVFERGLQVLGPSFPFLRERVSSFAQLARASVPELFGERLEGSGVLEMNTVASMVFLNRGGHMEATALPPEAQWSPVFGISVGDFDGDGHEDLFLAQNFSGNDPETPRQDAGRGLWLRGDGKGSFAAVPGQESGVMVYGEQRGCALADFDGDGRVDLVVTQNGNATRLYHNDRAKPGLRVHVRGIQGNPTGAGVQLRMVDDQGPGYAREIHLGAGYWSNDAGTQVMTSPGTPRRLKVRWPGGTTSEVEIPSGARDITVEPQGRSEGK